MLKKILIVLALAIAGPLSAQDGVVERGVLGNDIYAAGADVSLAEAGHEDAFLAGASVAVSAPVSGTVHTAGRWVDINAEVGGNLYAAGQRVRLGAAVAGDAALAGYSVQVNAAVGGDLRAFGSEVIVNGPVGESLIANGEAVEINAPISGDAVLSAHDLSFGPDAKVEGTLTLYESVVGATTVPESVVAADRLQRIELKYKRVNGAFQHPKGPPKPSFGEQLWDFVVWVFVVGLLTAALALVAPVKMGAARDEIAARPARLGLVGFVVLSVLTGGGVLVALTMIGMLLTPFFWIAASLLGLLGFFVAVFAVGSWVMGFAPGLSDARLANGAAAFAGALVVGLIGLIPFLGWIALVILGVIGAGALSLRIPAIDRFAG